MWRQALEFVFWGEFRAKTNQLADIDKVWNWSHLRIMHVSAMTARLAQIASCAMQRDMPRLSHATVSLVTRVKWVNRVGALVTVKERNLFVYFYSIENCNVYKQVWHLPECGLEQRGADSPALSFSSRGDSLAVVVFLLLFARKEKVHRTNSITSSPMWVTRVWESSILSDYEEGSIWFSILTLLRPFINDLFEGGWLGRSRLQ